ncbi:thioredoxin domain-containing protein [Stieleria varia]
MATFLFPMVLHAADGWHDDWNTALKAAREDSSRPILIKYEAAWCGPCQLLTEEMQQDDVKEVLQGYHLLRIDVDHPPAGAEVDSVTSLPTMRVITAGDEILQQAVGLAQDQQLINWLEQGASAYQQIVQRRQFAKRLSSGVLDAEQTELLLEMLQDRSSSQRSAATELLVQHPHLVAGQVVELLSSDKVRSRIAALDVLQRWPAPLDGIDPWQRETITAERVETLKSWSDSIASDDLAAEVDSKLVAEASSEALAEADLEIDRLLQRGPVREGLVDGLAVIGPELLPQVTTRLDNEVADVARERLTAVRYRLVASPTLLIRLPEVTDKLASLDASARRLAAQALSEQAQKDDVPLLEALFAHDDPLVRELALRGMQLSGGGEATELVRFLKDPDKNVRAAVLKLWLDAPRSYLSKTISEHALEESDPGLLVYYVRLLKEIGATKFEVQETLAQLAENDDWQVRAEVAEAIAHFTDNQSRPGASDATLHSGLRDAARQLLTDSDSFVLSKIVPAIIQADQEGSFDQLLLIAWRNPQIRDTVLPSLNAKFHDEDNVKFLTERFESDDSDARSFSLQAMSRLKVAEHEQYIGRALQDKDTEVQLAGVRALSAWLDNYHSKLSVLPKPLSRAVVADPFSNGFDVEFESEVMTFDNEEPSSGGVFRMIGDFLSGGGSDDSAVEVEAVEMEAVEMETVEVEADAIGAYEAELENATEAEPDEAPAAEKASTDITPTDITPTDITPIEDIPIEIGGDPFGGDDGGPISADVVESERVADASAVASEMAEQVDAYEAWLVNWRTSPSDVLPWLEGVKPIIERLKDSEDSAIKAHATLAAVRMGIEVESDVIAQSVSTLSASEGRLQAVYPWLPKDDRRELLMFVAETKNVDDYLVGLFEIANKFDQETIQADAWQALDRVNPQYIEHGYYLRSSMMELLTGESYFHSSSEKQAAALASSLEESVSTLDSQFARMMAVSLMGDIDATRVESLVDDAYDNTELDDATRRDWARMALGGKDSSEATELAIGWLSDETFQSIALDFIADGHGGISATEIGLLEVPNANASYYSSAKIITAEINPTVEPEMIKPLLDHGDPEIVAKATFVLIAMGQDVDITPLEKMFRSKGVDQYLRGWTNMYILAIAMRNQDADVAQLREIYEKVKGDEYRSKEFYWRIRIMTGPQALMLRKQIRDEVGMDNLI